MPKKADGIPSVVNLRLGDDLRIEWNEYFQNHKKNFDSVSHFIRSAVSEFVEIKSTINGSNQSKDEIENKINENKLVIEQILEDQRKLIDIIDHKVSSKNNTNDELKEFQRKIILNLLDKNDLDEAELTDYLEIDEGEVISHINQFLKIGAIEQVDNKYRKVKP